MTISSTTRIAGPFTGNGTASAFPFTFKVFAATDLDVIKLTVSTGTESTLVLTTDYTVTLNGDQNSNPGGTVTLTAGALASGFTLTITSDIANLQPTDLTNQGGFYPEVITDSLDRATIQIQQIADIGDRTLKIPISDGTLNMELPTATERANSFLSFDANGLPSVVTAGSSGAPATITRQVFSGTGSQTVFTLASDPGALGNSAQVYIGGVYQQRSTYTIAGTTLTFSAAPVAGTDNIEFVNFLTSTIGTTSADLVTYTPAGSGAVARSAASKFNEWVTLADFAGNITSAIASFGANSATFIINQDVTISSNLTIPSTINVWVENGAVITVNGGVTLTINGSFLGYTNQVFDGSGKVVFAATSVAAVLPEWFGAKADNSTDCTTAFAKTLAAATDTGLISGASILPVRLQSGTYVVGNVVLPAASQVYGTGKWITALKCKSGTTGAWLTDNGNANKIVIDGIGMYGNNESGITHGIQLGRGANPHGTEGAIRNVHVRDLPNATGFDVLGNVTSYSHINVWSCSTGFVIDGPHVVCNDLVAYACSVKSAALNLATVNGLEIEAPATGSLPLDLVGNTSIDGLTISLANSTTISHLIEQRAACTTWSIQGLEYIFPGTPSGIVVSNGNIKLENGTYVGGNASGASNDGEGNYSSSTFSINGQKLQCFKTRIQNTAGTLQHRVDDTSGNLYVGRVANSSTTLQNTPTGADATTAFAFGGKIGSASPSVFTFDTQQQPSNSPLFTAAIVFNNVGVAYTVVPFLETKNINGVTRTRLAIQLATLAGVSTNWSAALSTGGAIIDVQIMCFLA
jgi:hypothetical protein